MAYGSPWQENFPKFESCLLNEVRPLVEQSRSTASVRPAAIGRSPGCRWAAPRPSASACDTSTSSASLPRSAEPSPRRPIEKALNDGKRVNASLDLLWIACGRDDFLFARNEAFAAKLKEHGIKYEFHATERVHNYAYCRRYLASLAPRLESLELDASSIRSEAGSIQSDVDDIRTDLRDVKNCSSKSVTR